MLIVYEIWSSPLEHRTRYIKGSQERFAEWMRKWSVHFTTHNAYVLLSLKWKAALSILRYKIVVGSLESIQILLVCVTQNRLAECAVDLPRGWHFVSAWCSLVKKVVLSCFAAPQPKLPMSGWASRTHALEFQFLCHSVVWTSSKCVI